MDDTFGWTWSHEWNWAIWLNLSLCDEFWHGWNWTICLSLIPWMKLTTWVIVNHLDEIGTHEWNLFTWLELTTYILLYWYRKKHEHVNNIDITWMQITIWMKLNSLKFITLILLSMKFNHMDDGHFHSCLKNSSKSQTTFLFSNASMWNPFHPCDHSHSQG
jgi:hypothetical protein